MPLISNFGGSKHTELMDNGAIFPLFYLPPTGWFSRLIRCRPVLEKFEHFPKQTYRNRASIGSPNGKLDLIIPVIKGSGAHTAMKDVKISYDFDWQRQHWLSLQTAYRSSSWFEFYEDEFAPFYHQKSPFLFDYNEQFLRVLLRLLKISADYEYTTDYLPGENPAADYREIMHPKRADTQPVKPYFQLFEERNGFIPNLSIVDLLFSQGPQSPELL